MSARRSKSDPLPAPVAFLLTALGALIFGGLTQLGQTYLPVQVHSLANSAAPWVAIAFGLALLSHANWAACVSGALALAGLEAGYVVVAAMRDFPSAATTVAFWLTAAVVIGPLVGLAAHRLKVRDAMWGGLGGGLVAGIVSGEGLVSYLTVRDTTTPGYWVTQMAVGLIAMTVVGRRSRWTATVAGFAIGVAGLLASRSVPVFG